MGGVDQNHSNQDIGEKKYKTYFVTFTGNGTLVMCETLQWVGVGVGGSSFLCLLSRNTSTRLIGKQSAGEVKSTYEAIAENLALTYMEIYEHHLIVSNRSASEI